MLHLLCGKIASGKSTLAKKLAGEPGTVLISEDEWLGTLFADEIHSLDDYARCATRLRSVMAPHIVSLLKSGVSVVLDFPANTPRWRTWMRDLVTETGVPNVMHVLEVPDAVCLERLKARNAQGEHPFSTSEEQFHQVSSYFDPPSADEGFEIEVHRIGETGT
ncbi:MAG: ATP-binding protein [Pseudomonadota bacterium]